MTSLVNSTQLVSGDVFNMAQVLVSIEASERERNLWRKGQGWRLCSCEFAPARSWMEAPLRDLDDLLTILDVF